MQTSDRTLSPKGSADEASMQAFNPMALQHGKSGYLKVHLERGEFKVSRRAFTEQKVLEAEREAIFGRCWLYLGHESELKVPNAYLIRKVGGRELLFTRDSEGQYHCFFNSCPHRGARVAREASGVLPNFQCFYHGWVFRTNGKLRLLPEESYAPGFKDNGQVDLMPVARLEHYRGMYFVNFDAKAQSLSDFLGPTRMLLDDIFDQYEDGLEVHEGTQQYDIHANWKMLLENSYDGYHGKSVHISYVEYLINLNPDTKHFTQAASKFHDLGNGHAALVYDGPWGRPIARWVPAFGDARKPAFDAMVHRLKQRHGDERGQRMAHMSRNLGIFPNLVVNDIGGLTFRTFYPLAPDHMQVTAWGFGAKGEEGWQRELRLANFLEFLGPAGFATADDAEVLEQCQMGFSNNREVPWSDISRGLQKAVPDIDDEAQMRAYWTKWDELVGPVIHAETR